MTSTGAKRFLTAVSSVSLLSAAVAGSAIAQTQNPQTPTTPVGGHLPTRPELTQPVPNAPSRARIRVRDQGAMSQAPCPLSTSDLNVTITSVVFDSADGTPLPAGVAAALRGVGPDSTGETPIKAVCRIRDNANDALHRAGYIAAVQFPASNDLSTHVLHLMVVTAFIQEIRVHGDAGPFRKLIDERIRQLKALRPLNQFDAERILLEARDIPGFEASLSLRSAGTTPGAVIGDLTLARRPYDILVNAQNYGSPVVGPGTAFVRAEFYGLTGHADETYIGVSSTTQVQEQRVVQIGHLMGLGRRGDTIGASLIAAWSRPDLGALDLRTDSTIANVEYTHGFLRTINHSLRLSTGLDIVEQKTRVFTAGAPSPLNLDKLRIAYVDLGGGFQIPDRFGGARFVLRGNLGLRQGLDILDATERGKTIDGFQPSRPEGDPKAFVVRADADAVLAFGPVFSLATKLQSQWAKRPLLSYDEYSVGNLSIGRGYDPGANSGDSALGLRTELRAHIRDLGHGLNGDVYTFYDTVHLWNADVASTERNRTLDSWGAGFRVILPRHMVAEFMYAKPLDKALTIDKAPPKARILVSLTMQFGPNAE